MTLEIKSQDIGITLDNDEQIYAAIADLPISKGLVTLVCVFDGTVSLYYQNGSEMLGMCQKYEEVKKAGMSFLFSAGQTLQFLKLADNFNLPKGNKACVYLKTKNNTYKVEFDMSNTQEEEKHIQFLNFLIQNTMNAIRINSVS